jgi:outer membrane cobalamin receptor
MPLSLLRLPVMRRAPLRALLLVIAAAARHAEAAQTEDALSDDSLGSRQAPLSSADRLETVVIESTRLGGPEVSPTGANDYAVTSRDIDNMPAGDVSPITDVLAQMPGVAIDQNQQIHIRNTEGPQFQYQINGALVPFDINTNPPFLSMVNPQFVQQLDLLDGVLPARYSYATGGVVDIRTKDGCERGGADLSVLAGQRDTFQPSLQYAGCDGQLSSYVSLLYDQSNTAFSSATPAADAIHDHTRQGQAFGYFSYPLNSTSRVSLLLSGASSTNQLPNVPGLPPQYALAGIDNPPPSSAVNSDLDFSDYLAVLSLTGTPSNALSYQLVYSEHGISQRFEPDPVGELIYQGVASAASHVDHDHTLQADVTYALGPHTASSGFYAGDYRVSATDSSLVFPVDAACADSSGCVQSSDVPVHVINNTQASNVVLGAYLNDLWQMSGRLRADIGLRWDHLDGFTRDQQLSPTLNFVFSASPGTTLHAGFARYFQVPSFQGISPTAQAAFAGTSAAGPPGISTPLTEDDFEWDTGALQQLNAHLTLSADLFYERTHHYLDTGQFQVVPIFAPFNYNWGYIWGTELAARYQDGPLSGYVNLTIGRNRQQGVDTGQFNFAADELAYIDSHYIVLDHQPLYGASAGATYRLAAYSLNANALYSSGLRAGFADLVQLPQVLQVNVSGERAFAIRGLGVLTNRIAVLNVFNRVNLLRPAEGIGIFQSAYGPRLTFFDSLTLHF